MKKKLIGAVVGLMVWAADVGYFSYHLLPESSQGGPVAEQPYDLIAVLTGGQGRLREAFEIFKEERAMFLFISGVDETVKLDDILRIQGNVFLKDSLRQRVFLGSESTSTFENALEIVDFAEKHQVKKILLVTSSYHYRRAYALLKQEFKNRNISEDVSAFSVESPNFDRQGWWYTPTGWFILMTEYFKSLPLRITGRYNV